MVCEILAKILFAQIVIARSCAALQLHMPVTPVLSGGDENEEGRRDTKRVELDTHPSGNLMPRTIERRVSEVPLWRLKGISQVLDEISHENIGRSATERIDLSTDAQSGERDQVESDEEHDVSSDDTSEIAVGLPWTRVGHSHPWRNDKVAPETMDGGTADTSPTKNECQPPFILRLRQVEASIPLHASESPKFDSMFSSQFNSMFNSKSTHQTQKRHIQFQIDTSNFEMFDSYLYKVHISFC